MMNFLRKLISNNSGVSSKNFFLVLVTLIGCLLLLVPAFALTFEVILNSTINTNLDGFAAYIGAVAGLFATAGITKAWSEKYEHDKFMKQKDYIDEGPVESPNEENE